MGSRSGMGLRARRLLVPAWQTSSRWPGGPLVRSVRTSPQRSSQSRRKLLQPQGRARSRPIDRPGPVAAALSRPIHRRWLRRQHPSRPRRGMKPSPRMTSQMRSQRRSLSVTDRRRTSPRPPDPRRPSHPRRRSRRRQRPRRPQRLWLPRPPRRSPRSPCPWKRARGTKVTKVTKVTRAWARVGRRRPRSAKVARLQQDQGWRIQRRRVTGSPISVARGWTLLAGRREARTAVPMLPPGPTGTACQTRGTGGILRCGASGRRRCPWEARAREATPTAGGVPRALLGLGSRRGRAEEKIWAVVARAKKPYQQRCQRSSPSTSRSRTPRLAHDRHRSLLTRALSPARAGTR
mmetsp:Transcript_37270/g.85297  ORF Transcript_37270/g.85297 Transcript_37270/m.85297 type:complete len:349 (+) Transcript_37270:1444-2490(+)